MTSIDRNTAHSAQKWMQDKFAIKFLVDDVANRAWTSELQHDCIHPRNVIGQEKESAFRQILCAERGDAIKTAHQCPSEKIQGVLSRGDGSHCL